VFSAVKASTTQDGGIASRRGKIQYKHCIYMFYAMRSCEEGLGRLRMLARRHPGK
jgi:hypothetical protein